MFEDKLINEIFKRSCLWDRRTKAYNNKLLKEKAWNEVALSLRESETNCRKRWKSLRDKFVIEYHGFNDATSSTKKIKWQFFDSMLFLKDQITSRKPDSTAVSQDCSEPPEQYSEIDVAAMYPRATFSPHENEDSSTSLEKLITIIPTENTMNHKKIKLKEQFEATFSPPHHQNEDTCASIENLFKAAPSSASKLKNHKKLKFEENFNFLMEKAETLLDRKTKSSAVDPMLHVVQEYINQLEESEKLDFKFDILKFVHEKFNEYKNKK